MSDLEHHYISGIYCNRCDARRETENGELISRFSVHATEFYARAQADGWSRWCGRSVRDYCRACVPGPGHKMRRLW